MREYDYIIAGGGLAGLSLLYHLLQSSLKNFSIALVDRERKSKNDRTWCYWTNEPHIFDSIAYSRWDYLHFYGAIDDGAAWQQRFSLRPYRYQMVRGIDFYQEVNRLIDQFPNVERLFGSVDKIIDESNGARVEVDGQEYFGRYVFDSRFVPESFFLDRKKYHDVKQHFLGWEIECSRDVFDPQALTLFDFRLPQQGEMRFMYVLPTSARKAIVEFTLFSNRLLKREEYEQELERYVREVLYLSEHEYQVIEQENGIIPMTDQPFQRKIGKHQLRIGTAGGMVKASTGYAFFRIQKDSAAIVESLERYSHPFALKSSPLRYRLFDTLLLDILQYRGELAEPIFTRLFAHNPIGRLFRFLDEQGGVRENLLLMATTRWRYFFRAMWDIVIHGKGRSR